MIAKFTQELSELFDTFGRLALVKLKDSESREGLIKGAAVRLQAVGKWMALFNL